MWYMPRSYNQAVEVLNLRRQNMVMSPAGTGPENDYAGEEQQQL
jgi:hypothetical protein